MAINKTSMVKETDQEAKLVTVEMNLDDGTGAFNWIIFKDVQTSTLYKLQIKNGKVDVEAV